VQKQLRNANSRKTYLLNDKTSQTCTPSKIIKKAIKFLTFNLQPIYNVLHLKTNIQNIMKHKYCNEIHINHTNMDPHSKYTEIQFNNK
jgi:hypothetical protein